MPKDKNTKSALELVHEWSKDRPLWIRDALRQIVNDGLPGDEAIKELSDICMACHELGEARPPVALDEDGAKKLDAPADAICLTRIADVQGVNQLAPNQEVQFGASNLTIIYGANGAGKSGYTRILKRICNARHRGEIMPDAFAEANGKSATAQISYLQNNEDQGLSWVDSDIKTFELQSVSIFDRECAATHLNQKNPVLFRPFGLDIPDDLATVCTKVKAVLEDQKRVVEQSSDPLFEDPIWSNTSDIGQFLNELTFRTDPDAFPEHLKLSEEEIAELSRLQKDLASDPARTAAGYQQNAVSIQRFGVSLNGLANQLGDESMAKFLDTKKGALSARDTAKAAAEQAFGDLELGGVGEPVWRGLWDAARRFSEVQTEPERTFPPQVGDPCALCHQPISVGAAERMSGFEAFILADTEAKAGRLEQELEEQVQQLLGIRLEFRQYAPELAILKERAPDTAKLVRRFLAGLRMRRRQAMASDATKEIHDLPPNPGPELIELATYLNEYATNLLSGADTDERDKLVEIYNQLNDRNQSTRLNAIAKSEIERLKKMKALEDCIAECGTTAITRLGNDIADQTITPAMRDRFYDEIVKLAANKVRVEIVRTGGKAGSPQYEVKFLANKKAKVANVLSEGEQTCVALAAHLTELTNEKTGSALVFDDPVTSLDHRWRRKVAERLVDEASRRQVIVFTHDLVFVNDLHDKAESNGLTVHLGTLERTAEGCGVYSENLPWRAASIKQRVDQMEKDVRAAKKHYDDGDEEPYRKAVVEIFGQLRAAWERALEDRVFAGVIMRHRDYLNTKQLKRVAALDVSDVAVFEENFGKCCDFIEAHDPSRGRDGDVPPPEDVARDIQMLSDWETKLRNKQNDLEKAPVPNTEPHIRVVQ